MNEDLAELVVLDLSEKGALAAEGGKARDRIGAGAARAFDGFAHTAIEHVGALRVDQCHAALLDVLKLQEGVVGIGDHIDEGIADAGNVIFQLAHISGSGLL